MSTSPPPLSRAAAPPEVTRLSPPEEICQAAQDAGPDSQNIAEAAINARKNLVLSGINQKLWDQRDMRRDETSATDTTFYVPTFRELLERLDDKNLTLADISPAPDSLANSVCAAVVKELRDKRRESDRAEWMKDLDKSDVDAILKLAMKLDAAQVADTVYKSRKAWQVWLADQWPAYERRFVEQAWKEFANLVSACDWYVARRHVPFPLKNQ